jgi:hypothetical protein
MRGVIRSEISITCGGGIYFIRFGMCNCKEISYTGNALSCRIRWQEYGWKYTKKYGWLCPPCARMHTKQVKSKKTKKGKIK